MPSANKTLLANSCKHLAPGQTISAHITELYPHGTLCQYAEDGLIGFDSWGDAYLTVAGFDHVRAQEPALPQWQRLTEAYNSAMHFFMCAGPVYDHTPDYAREERARVHQAMVEIGPNMDAARAAENIKFYVP